MKTNRLLRFTLAVSLLAHGVIILARPGFNPFTPAPKLQEIAVRYIKEKDKPAQPKIPQSPGRPGGKVLGRAPLPYIEPAAAPTPASQALFNKAQGFAKPVFSHPEMTAVKKKISLPAMPAAKIDNPTYISYYQIVREKIRRSAYQNYMHNVTGEVYVSFIIANDGRIKDVRLVEDKTTVNDYLQKVAVRSIRDASPFPAFPKELDYPQLSFNIIISFEIE